MDARVRCLLLLVAVAPTLGASARTRNFVVTAPTPQLAKEIALEAERFRRELAIEWLERELPDWRRPCPIVAKVNPQLSAGGRTSFMFDMNRVPHGWDMEIQGSRERVLDSVLPHEITHTIFATHFGRPLPRWADEGACTVVEHDHERKKQEQWLIRFLKTERGIPFNHMFAMTEYPSDILPLYSQGYSVARYLIAQGGKPTFVKFVGFGMDTGNWPAAVSKFYGFKSLGDLQLTWVEWVKKGSPDEIVKENADAVQLASTSTSSTPPQPPQPTAEDRGNRPLIDNTVAMASAPSRPDGPVVPGRSYYARRQVNEKPLERKPLLDASLPNARLIR